jgi:hypothetical protein
MFDMYLGIFVLVYIILGATEFLVFNEEMLLALCFFSFIFFAFNTLSDSVAESFTSRAAKFESDLLVSYESTKTQFVAQFDFYFSRRQFLTTFKSLFSFLLLFLNYSKSSISLSFSLFFSDLASSKLIELSTVNTALVSAFHKNTVSFMIYPLIFQTAKITPSLISPSVVKNDISLNLKHFSY